MSKMHTIVFDHLLFNKNVCSGRAPFKVRVFQLLKDHPFRSGIVAGDTMAVVCIGHFDGYRYEIELGIMTPIYSFTVKPK